MSEAAADLLDPAAIRLEARAPDRETAIRLCGHCQLGPEFICHDGPVFTSDRVGPLLRIREL